MSLFELPERKAGAVISVIGALFAAAYVSSLVIIPKPDGRILLGDALHHYVQLRSVVFDGDLHFRNEYVRVYGLKGGEPDTGWVYEPTATGRVRNLMPVGPAIVWAPLFLLVTAGVWIANLAGATYPLDGYARVFQATPGISGVVAATVGVWLAWRAAALVFSARTAAWATLIVWLATSAVYYSVISPAYSHAASLLTTSAFWYVFVRTIGSASVARFALLGALGGACALMRWQDAIILLVPAVELAHQVRGGLPVARAARAAAACGAAAVLAFSPQMIVWQSLYGQPLAIPQGEGFMRWTAPALVQVLFSDWHGLLTWTPVVAAALAGLILLPRNRHVLGSAAIVFFVVSWYVNAAVADWWAGEAFGSRRFVSCFAVFVFGLGALIERWSPSLGRLALGAAVVVAHTFLLVVQYQLFMHGFRDIAPYPRGAYGLWLARFVVPFELVRDWPWK